MYNTNKFFISNNSSTPIVINIEPYGVFYHLKQGHDVLVSESYDTAPLTIKITSEDDGMLVYSIWPGDGDVVVTHQGVDVLKLI